MKLMLYESALYLRQCVASVDLNQYIAICTVYLHYINLYLPNGCCDLRQEAAETTSKKLQEDIEERLRETSHLRKDIEEYKESSRHLKEIVVKREKSLQEKVQVRTLPIISLVLMMDSLCYDIVN